MQRTKKNKQPHFRQLVPHNYLFQASEQQKQLSESQITSLEQIQDREQKYNSNKKIHYDELETKRKVEEKSKKEYILNFDTDVHVRQLENQLKDIESVETVEEMNAIRPDKSTISRWVINCAKLTKLDSRHLCAIDANGKSACDKQDDVGNFTTAYDSKPPLFDGYPLKKAATEDLEGCREDIQSKGDILSASFLMMVWNSSTLLTEGNNRNPIPGLDNSWASNDYNTFHDKLYVKWHARHSQEKQDYKCVPLRPFLCYFYLMDGENELVLDSKLAKYVHMVKNSIESSQLEMPFIHTAKGDLSIYPYKNKTKASTSSPDLTQGLDFSELSKSVFMLFLGTVMVHSYELPELSIDWDVDIGHRCLAVYEWVCRTQETHLKSLFKAERIHWSFSEWGASGGFMPSLLGHEAQSMEHLNVRLVGNTPVCSACPKQYMTYYGANWYAVNKERDSEQKNYSGICTQYIDEIADLLELTEAEKNNGWWLNWVGTWQQAQRRLNAYKKKQQEMYDNSDPRYSFVEYYMNLMILQVDLWVKKLFNVCNVAVDKSGDENKELTEAEKKQWAWVDAAKAGGVAAGAATGAAAGTFFGGPLGTAIGAAAGGLGAAFATYGASTVFGTMREMVRVGGVLLYKIIGLVMRSPMVQEGLLKLATDYKEKICIQTAAKSRAFDIVKTGDDGELMKMNDLGQWYNIPVKEQEKIEQSEAINAEKKEKRKFFQFFAVLQEMGSGTDAGWLTQALGATSLYIEGAFGKIVDLLMYIPGIGRMMQTVGLDEHKLQGIIIVALTQTGTKNFNAMVKANSTFSRLEKLYHVLIEGGSSCLTDGRLVIKDGGLLGDGAQYVQYAWETMQFNIPYYAVMILNEMASNSEMVKKIKNGKVQYEWEDKVPVYPWSSNFKTEKLKYMQNFITSQQVPGGKAAATDDQKAGKVQEYNTGREAIHKWMDIELKRYDVMVEDLKQHERANNMSYSNPLGKSKAVINIKLAAKTGNLGTLMLDLTEEEKNIDKQVKEFIEKQLREDQMNNLYWWAAALAIGAGIGLAVATGGASVAIQAGMGAAASAVGTVGTAAATVGTTVAANVGGITAAVAVAKTTLDTAIDKNEQKVIFLGASTLMYRGLGNVKEYMNHWNDGYKTFIIGSLFENQYAWGEIFREQLSVAIDKLATEAKKQDDTTTTPYGDREHMVKCIQFRKIISKQDALTIKWTEPAQLPFLDIDKCIKLFEAYGDVIV